MKTTLDEIETAFAGGTPKKVDTGYAGVGHDRGGRVLQRMMLDHTGQGFATKRLRRAPDPPSNAGSSNHREGSPLKSGTST